MGQMNLEQYHTRMRGTLDDPGIDADLLTIWINAAQYEVIGAVEFEFLKTCATAPLGRGQNALKFPEDAWAILALSDVTMKKNLLYTIPERLHRLDRPHEGQPRLWAELNKVIEIWPAADRDRTILITYYREPEPFEELHDISWLPTTFDNAIYFFAMQHAYIDMGEDEKALLWLERGTNYLRTRIMDKDLHAGILKEGVHVVGRERALMDAAATWPIAQ